jgi:hypothetical protein
MLDIELYRAILGLPIPWTVLGVDLDVKERQVTVQVHAGEGGPAAHHLGRGVGDQGARGDPGPGPTRAGGGDPPRGGREGDREAPSLPHRGRGPGSEPDPLPRGGSEASGMSKGGYQKGARSSTHKMGVYGGRWISAPGLTHNSIWRMILLKVRILGGVACLP